MNIQKKHGYLVTDGLPPKRSNDDVIVFSGHTGLGAASFGMTEDHLDKHTLLIGSTGCGKTTLMNSFIQQIQSKMTKNDVMLIFDSKGDFFQNMVIDLIRYYLVIRRFIILNLLGGMFLRRYVLMAGMIERLLQMLTKFVKISFLNERKEQIIRFSQVRHVIYPKIPKELYIG